MAARRRTLKRRRLGSDELRLPPLVGPDGSTFAHDIWAALDGATEKCSAAYAAAPAPYRAAAGAIVNLLGALRAAVALSDGAALAHFDIPDLSKAAATKAVSSVSPQTLSAQYSALPEITAPAKSPKELARAILEDLRGAASAQGRCPLGREPEAIPILYVAGQLRGLAPRHGESPGAAVRIGVPSERVVCAWGFATRIEIALWLAHRLRGLSAPETELKSVQALAERIYAKMPCYGTQADSAGRHRDSPFREDHRRVVFASFRAAGVPESDVKNLFGLEHVRAHRKRKKATRSAEPVHKGDSGDEHAGRSTPTGLAELIPAVGGEPPEGLRLWPIPWAQPRYLRARHVEGPVLGVPYFVF